MILFHIWSFLPPILPLFQSHRKVLWLLYRTRVGKWLFFYLGSDSFTYEKSSWNLNCIYTVVGPFRHWSSPPSSNAQFLIRKEKKKSTFPHVSLLRHLGLIFRGSGQLIHWQHWWVPVLLFDLFRVSHWSVRRGQNLKVRGDFKNQSNQILSFQRWRFWDQGRNLLSLWY